MLHFTFTFTTNSWRSLQRTPYCLLVDFFLWNHGLFRTFLLRSNGGSIHETREYCGYEWRTIYYSRKLYPQSERSLIHLLSSLLSVSFFRLWWISSFSSVIHIFTYLLTPLLLHTLSIYHQFLLSYLLTFSSCYFPPKKSKMNVRSRLCRV